MEDNQNANEDEITSKQELFRKTIDIVYDKVFGGKIPPEDSNNNS